MIRTNATSVLVAGLVVAAALVDAPSSRAAHAPPLTTRNGVVASDDPKASEVGATILARGGNAVDAAVATAFALGVVNPASSGVGGGGFAIVHIAAEGKTYVYDFREVAPAALDPGDFVVEGKVDPMRARRGGLAVGVPGEVAGLGRMHERHGALSWRRVVSPAARLARDGFDAGFFVSRSAGRALPGLPDEAPYAALRTFLAPGGSTLARGDRVVREDLARTLLAIATGGPGAFYEGAIADDIAATAVAAGGVLTVDDLRAYEIVEREPLWGEWRGMRVATMPLPSSGGFLLLEIVGILDALEARGVDLAALGVGSSAAFHVLAEVLKHGFADRARLLGDTDDARAIAQRLLDPEGLRTIARRIDLAKTAAHDSYGHPALARPGATTEGGGTSHLCVVDADGNAVAMTTTVNGLFGAKLVTAGGIVLNNQIDDFALEAGVPNQFGLVQSEHNLVAPGKRPLSSMTPVLLLEGDRVVACAGGSGGPYIISNVAQVLVGMFEFGLDVREAVEASRIHHQWLPDVLRHDPEIPRDVLDALAKRGHTLKSTDDPRAVQAIRVLPDGSMQAASDPRKNGAPAAPP